VYEAESNAELRAIYDGWATEYDADRQAFGYSYPPVIAGLVARYVRERDAPILDAGAGIVGEVLAILGRALPGAPSKASVIARTYGFEVL
jgi:hypothetical protein